jgi:hypothetical protein
MNTKQEKGIPQEKLASMTVAQRQAAQRDAERERLHIVKEMESLLADISKKKKGRSFKMRNPKRLGHRPNDTVEE